MRTAKPHLALSYPPQMPRELSLEKSAMRTLAFWLSLILILTIAFERILLFEGLGTVSRAMGILVAVFWMVAVLATGRFRKPHPFHMAVYLFVLWNTASVFWSVDVDLTLARVVTYLQLALLVFILWDLYATPAALKAGLQVFILGAYVSIGGTIANYLAASEIFSNRYAATGFHVNVLGLIVALGIPVAWHLAVSEGHGKANHVLRLANYAYIPAAVLAIILTASRGAMVAAIPACLYVLWSLTRLKRFQRILILAALIGAFYALQPLVPEASLQRLATIGPSIAGGDLGGRIEVWRKGIAVFSEHPLLGIGSGAFPTAIESVFVAHNSFLSVLVEVGMIGFALFACILAIAVYQAVHQPRWDARLWLTVLLVWALGASAASTEHTKQTWLFLNFVVVSASLSVRRDETTSDSGSPAASLDSAGAPAVNRDGQATQYFLEA